MFEHLVPAMPKTSVLWNFYPHVSISHVSSLYWVELSFYNVEGEERDLTKNLKHCSWISRKWSMGRERFFTRTAKRLVYQSRQR